MDAEWITSPTARRVLMHWADQRPAWLWSGDGSTLLWRNGAARLFNAKMKKHGLKLSAAAVPIKGQVARLIRLGSVGRSSLSRVQFLAGDKPVATTCSCTPLVLASGEAALLLVGVDAISEEIRAAAPEVSPDAMSESLFPAGMGYRLVEPGTELPPDALAIKASPREDMLVFGEREDAATIDEVRAEEGISADDSEDELDLADLPEPMLPMGIAPIAPEPTPTQESDHWVEPLPEDAQEGTKLSSLFDRLADDEALYSPLSAADETFPGAAPEEEAPDDATDDLIAAVIEYADDPETAEEEAGQPVAEIQAPAPNASVSQWLITGRGFRALPPKPEARDEVAPPDTEEAAVEEASTEPKRPEAQAPVADAAPQHQPETDIEIAAPAETTLPPEPETIVSDATPPLLDGEDPETVERVTRYNFEELGRILTDRVAGEAKAEATPEPAAAAPNGIINLNAETLVLNRLPLAILVFRDQQVLFANRALTDLLGHESVESLRSAGIASIFPSEDAANAGPVNRLMRRDSTPIDVTARLQSVSWQGRAALMLSASPSEQMRGHEGAVRAFAEIAAEARGEGYISADRSGTITFVSVPGRALLSRNELELVGKPLAVLVSNAEMEGLRAFLEKPARFAETTRPHFSGASADGGADIVLFAEGQAGIVSGYFGFIKRRQVTQVAPGKDDDLDPGLLGRLSRGIRRPLNTIIGFADLLRSNAIEGGSSDRTAEYARDIRTAGLEIAVLADELDDFTRLRDGNYTPRTADVDLGSLLESCMVRVRPQAAAARVLVRSSVSEQLPRVRADRSSLGQGLLNLLASAIDQTPLGGSVILSAQTEEDGGVTIHVRDGAQSGTDIGERFVVFRDGLDKDGEQLAPVRSSVGLALTRSLLAVNACSLSIDPTATTGTLFSLTIPADAVVRDERTSG